MKKEVKTSENSKKNAAGQNANAPRTGNKNEHTEKKAFRTQNK